MEVVHLTVVVLDPLSALRGCVRMVNLAVGSDSFHFSNMANALTSSSGVHQGREDSDESTFIHERVVTGLYSIMLYSMALSNTRWSTDSMLLIDLDE
jgi:hypothetical protein